MDITGILWWERIRRGDLPSRESPGVLIPELGEQIPQDQLWGISGIYPRYLGYPQDSLFDDALGYGLM